MKKFGECFLIAAVVLFIADRNIATSLTMVFAGIWNIVDAISEIRRWHHGK